MVADTTGSNPWDNGPIYRSQAEANAFLPEAQQVVRAVKERLSEDIVRIDPGTLFVDQTSVSPVAWFAAGLVGIPLAVTAVQIDLQRSVQENTNGIVEAILAWRRERLAEGTTDGG